MAAYASLVSLIHIIEQIQNHPRPPISLHKEQVESLREKIIFLQNFLEAYNSHEVEHLKSRIADAAYAAEDILESHVVDQIRAQSASTHDEEKICCADFYQGLHKVIEDMDFIVKEAGEIQDKTGIFQDQPQTNSTLGGSLRSRSIGQKSTLVGFDDLLKEVMEKLTGQPPTRQIIPIVGMGGIGKTTLASNVYTNPLVEYHFDVRAWVMISQEYSLKGILTDVLLCQKNQESIEKLGGKSEQDLGLQLYQNVLNRRYLIIMDDMWDVEAWDKVKFYFPDNNNGSRIIITTLSELAMHLTDTGGLEMNFLDEETSWNLLCKTIFGEEECLLDDFEKIGKKIAKNCQGLPLSIVVVGGLLAKSKRTAHYWGYIAENLNSIVNLENEEQCLQILKMSYNQLSVHLQPCFLYLGIFPEDSKIRISELIRLWIAEGFLKPSSGKSLEEIAQEYLMALIDRNLILVSERGCSGSIKFCKIHDLLRDLCLREARKEKFFCVASQLSLNTPHEGIIPNAALLFFKAHPRRNIFTAWNLHQLPVL